MVVGMSQAPCLSLEHSSHLPSGATQWSQFLVQGRKGRQRMSWRGGFVQHPRDVSAKFTMLPDTYVD